MHKRQNSIDRLAVGCMWWPAGFAWLFISLLGWFGSLLGAAGAVVFFVVIYRLSRDREYELSGGFEAYADAYTGLSERELVNIVVQDELGRRFGTRGKPISRTSLRIRTGLVVVYTIINFLLIHFFHYCSWVIIACAALTLVTELVFLHVSTVNVLCHMAKRNPDTPISHLIEQDVFDDCETTIAKKLLTGGAAMLVLSLLGVIMLNTSSRMVFTKEADGYCLTSYKPGMLTFREEVPATYEGQPVVAIAPRVFENNAILEQVTLPQTLVRIGGRAFRNCSSLSSIAIPQGVTEIRGNTFEGCTMLKTVLLHNGIIDIHAYAFRNCSSLKSIQLPLHITEIHAYTFEGCSDLTSIEIPEGVTRIAAHAFYGCSDLSYVYVPTTVREIGSSAFRECDSLEQIRIPRNAVVNERAFKESPTAVLYQ